MNYSLIIQSINQEIQSKNKTMILMIDDLIGGFGPQHESQILKAILDLKLRVTVASTEDCSRELTRISNHFVIPLKIDALDLKQRIIEELGSKEYNIHLAEKGEFLLDIIGRGGRSFGCFWELIRTDDTFRKYCCSNDGTMQDLLKLFLDGWKTGIYGPTHIFEAALTLKTTMKFFCGFVSLSFLKIALPKQSQMWYQDCDEWKDEMEKCEGFGLINLSNDSHEQTVSISPFILYVWSLEVLKLYDPSKTLHRLEKGIYNIGKYIQYIFSGVLSGRWDGLAVEDEIGFLIGLRLNCTKYLIEIGLFHPKCEFSTLDAVMQYGVKKADTNNSEQKPTVDNQLKENLERYRKRKHSFTGSDTIHFIKMKWQDIGDIKNVGSFEADSKQNESDAVKKIFSETYKNCGALFTFVAKQPAFDYLLKLPLMDINSVDFDRLKRIVKDQSDAMQFNFRDLFWIWMFVECKSRGKAEDEVSRKFVNNLIGVIKESTAKGVLEKKDKTKQGSKKTTQFAAFLSMIHNVKRFENEDYVYCLYADMPLSPEKFLEVEAVDQVVLRLGGEFGKFLKDFVVNERYAKAFKKEKVHQITKFNDYQCVKCEGYKIKKKTSPSQGSEPTITYCSCLTCGHKWSSSDKQEELISQFASMTIAKQQEEKNNGNGKVNDGKQNVDN